MELVIRVHEVATPADGHARLTLIQAYRSDTKQEWADCVASADGPELIQRVVAVFKKAIS